MNYDREIPKAGDAWRHFKTGKIVTVIAVANNTENPGSYSVIYKCPDGSVWARPLDMFMSEVDRDKYPDAKQKYRFEKIEVERDCRYCTRGSCSNKTLKVTCWDTEDFWEPHEVEDPIQEAKECGRFDLCRSDFLEKLERDSLPKY